MGDINIWAVLVAALSSFLLGGLWYSPVMFYKLWLRESKVEPQEGHQAMVYILSFIFSVIAALALAYWLGPAPALTVALKYSLIAGAGFVATSFGTNYQFSNRSTLLWLIDGGYHIVQFLIFGLILGLWH